MISSPGFTVSVFRAEEKCGSASIAQQLGYFFRFFAVVPHSIQNMIIFKIIEFCSHNNINMTPLQMPGTWQQLSTGLEIPPLLFVSQ